MTRENPGTQLVVLEVVKKVILAAKEFFVYDKARQKGVTLFVVVFLAMGCSILGLNHQPSLTVLSQWNLSFGIRMCKGLSTRT